MNAFNRMIRDYEEQKEREYKLANPCTHEGSNSFVWGGTTMCWRCCEHEYRNKIVDHNGEWLCTLCWVIVGPILRDCVPRPRKSTRRARKRRTPKIYVFDENGKQRRVKYWE